MRTWQIFAAASFILPAPAMAQDYGAFDMGVLGTNGAIDQATQQARRQARGRT